MIEEQQTEYDKAKRAISRREEKRLASIEEQNHAEDEDENAGEENLTNQASEQPGSFDDTEDDIIVDDDDYSLPSTSSVNLVSPISGARCSSRSLFASALSALPSHSEED